MPRPNNLNCLRICREEAGRAVDALLRFLGSVAKQRKSQLFEHDDFLYLHISLCSFPSTSRLNPYRISLPHTLHPLDPSRTSLCLIAGDSLADAARATAAAEKLPFDSVIPLSDLRTDYVPFESRRRLCDSYDIFFAERRIITLLSRLIGNYFFKKKKIPLPVDISRPGWPEAVRQACRSSLLFFGSGTCIGMKFGRVSMDREEIIDNLMTAVEGAVKYVPKKWANIRCIYIKAVQSVALPIYQAIPEMAMKIDVGSGENVKPLDEVIGYGGEGEAENEKSGKRKGRIHEVNYVSSELVDRSEECDGETDEGKENDEVQLENMIKLKKKMKKLKKNEEKVKVIKSKKCSTACDYVDDGEEKGIGSEFIELDTGKKKRKRANKIASSNVEEHDIKDNLAVSVAAIDDVHGNDKEFPLKNKVKSKCKKGKKDTLHGSNNDHENLGNYEEVNVMNANADNADDAGSKYADIALSHVQRKLKSCKSGKYKKIRKANKPKLRQ